MERIQPPGTDFVRLQLETEEKEEERERNNGKLKWWDVERNERQWRVKENLRVIREIIDQKRERE